MGRIVILSMITLLNLALLVLIVFLGMPLVWSYHAELHAGARNGQSDPYGWGFGSRGYGDLWYITLADSDDTCVAIQIGVYWPNVGDGGAGWILVGWINSNDVDGWMTNGETWLYYEYAPSEDLRGTPESWIIETGDHIGVYRFEVSRVPPRIAPRKWVVRVGGERVAEVEAVSTNWYIYESGLPIVHAESYDTENSFIVKFYQLEYAYEMHPDLLLWADWDRTTKLWEDYPLHVFIPEYTVVWIYQ